MNNLKNKLHDDVLDKAKIINGIHARRIHLKIYMQVERTVRDNIKRVLDEK